MNIRTLDAAVLCNPFETYRAYFGEEKYDLMIARAFEFYEGAVRDGILCSYGISGHNSLHGTD